MVEMRVRLLRTVHRPERVRVRTWPSSHRSRFATRDFLVFADSELVPFCAADTRWVVLDLASGRPAGLPSGLRSLLPEEGPRALADDAPRLPEVEAPWFTRAFDVRLSDLDINGHVNHVHYLEWIAEAVPDDVVREKQLTELQVVFRQSAGQGDRVSIDTEPIAGHGGAFVHRLTCPERSALLVRARSLWRECGPEGAG
jgi:acyl-ACP thioesterase